MSELSRVSTVLSAEELEVLQVMAADRKQPVSVVVRVLIQEALSRISAMENEQSPHKDSSEDGS